MARFESRALDILRAAAVYAWLSNLLDGPARPSAKELLEALETARGLSARWHLREVAERLATQTGPSALRHADRDYLRAMLEDGSLEAALRGEDATTHDVASTIDTLLRQSAVYRSTAAFREMVEFMAKFRRYSPYNNMLVRTQNPSCGFYATDKVWHENFKRWVKEDARPMLILAPKHPVMLVYDLDQTDGPLPQKLEELSNFDGPWEPDWLAHLAKSAAGHGIDVAFKTLSSTRGGFATSRARAPWKMRIVVHDGLDEPSRFGVLCHELAHILLGHLGSDADRWWPGRANLDHRTVEIEAESVAHIVTARFGLTGTSTAYLSGYTKNGAIPPSVSLDTVAKVAAHIQKMAEENMAPRKPRPLAKTKAARSPA